MGAFVTLAGQDVFTAKITLPRRGVWHAELCFDGPVPVGRVPLHIGDAAPDAFDLIGTCRPARSGQFAGATWARIIGGAGGLNLQASPLSYRAIQAGQVLSAICTSGQEVVSPSVDPSFSGFLCDHWATLEEPLGQTMESLVQSVDADMVWRVLADGTVWVGRESWPASRMTSFELLDFDPRNAMWGTSANGSPNVFPGELITDKSTGLAGFVSRVLHSIDGDRQTTRLWMEDGP